MQTRVPITERAFQIARSGTVSTVSEIKIVLRQEGYSVDLLQGPTLLKQLLAVIRAERQRGKPPE
jgi:hypothetical protein